MYKHEDARKSLENLSKRFSVLANEAAKDSCMYTTACKSLVAAIADRGGSITGISDHFDMSFTTGDKFTVDSSGRLLVPQAPKLDVRTLLTLCG